MAGEGSATPGAFRRQGSTLDLRATQRVAQGLTASDAEGPTVEGSPTGSDAMHAAAVHRQQKWGAPWSPYFPTNEQICQEVEDILTDHHQARNWLREGSAGHNWLQGSQSTVLPGEDGELEQPSSPLAVTFNSTALSPAAGGRTLDSTARKRPQLPRPPPPDDFVKTGEPFHWQKPTSVTPHPIRRRKPLPGAMIAPSSQAPTSDTAAVHRWPYEPEPQQQQQRQQHVSIRSSVPARRMRKFEPAKVVGPDGKVTLRGVRSTSDLKRYTAGVDPHSRNSWEVREAFKRMRNEQHAAAATQTWAALHNWKKSEKSFDKWHSEVGAKGGRCSASTPSLGSSAF